jgi:hypothetical protein
MLTQPYNSPFRISSDQGGSTRHRALYGQIGQIASKIHTAVFYIPCGIKHPQFLHLTPVVSGSVSANGVALGTTTVVAELASLDTFSALADLDAWVASAAMIVGNLVKNPAADGAYICVVAHGASATNSEAGFQADVTLGYWQLISEEHFLKVTSTSPGSSKNTFCAYKIEGFNE